MNNLFYSIEGKINSTRQTKIEKIKRKIEDISYLKIFWRIWKNVGWINNYSKFISSFREYKINIGAFIGILEVIINCLKESTIFLEIPISSLLFNFRNEIDLSLAELILASE